MSKYIIKNCPAYCYLGKECHNEESQYGVSCCEVTDCVMKQIVNLCKRTCRMRCTNDCLGTKKHCGYGQILKLLGIQEVCE